MMECQNVTLSEEVKGKGTNASAWSWWKSLRSSVVRHNHWQNLVSSLSPEASPPISVFSTIIGFQLPFEVEWLLLYMFKTCPSEAKVVSISTSISFGLWPKLKHAKNSKQLSFSPHPLSTLVLELGVSVWLNSCFLWKYCSPKSPNSMILKGW